MKRFGGLARPLLATALIFYVFACSGGGCSGCAGCGIAPIPGGFPLAERMPNAAQARLTSGGIQFLEDNVEAIVERLLRGGLDFPIPRTSGSTSGIDYEVCPRNDCVAHAEIHSLDLTPVPPNRLSGHLRVVLDSRDSAGARRAVPVRIDPPLLPPSTCDVDIDTRRGSRPYVALVFDVDLVTETRPARMGYTKIVVSRARIVEGEDIENDDVRASGCFYAWLINLFRGTLINELQRQVDRQIQSAAAEQLCQRRGAYGCPTGTTDRGNTAEDAICYYEPAGGSDECVPILLGTDGRGDLGHQMLGGFSPGAHAPVQFVLAAGGDGEAVNEGLSLFMVGGFMSMDTTFTRSPGHNPCVPLVEPPPLREVRRIDAFRGNLIPGTSTPAHVGIGIAEDYLDHVGYGLFDSGMLCIGTGTRLSQQLSTGLVSAVIPSLRNLVFPAGNAPLALAVRPQRPPDFTIGTSPGQPLLAIALPELQIDFYVWSTERYIRFMTFQTDLTIRVDLSVEGGEIVPRIDGVDAQNSRVFNSELLSESPSALATTLQTVISMFADMIAGGIDPIALPTVMGFELEVPPGGVRGLSEGGEAMLTIWANLRLAAPSMVVRTVETTLEARGLELDRESMTLARWGQGEGNRVWLELGAEAPGSELEFSYRIDGMTWSPWTRERRILVDHDALLLQARHVIEARARIAGEPRSADPTPARVEVIVDIEPPVVELARAGAATVTAHAQDLITPEESLRYRFRVQGGEWSAWDTSPTFDLGTWVLDGGLVEVEVVDEAGNVGSASMPLIRGVPDPNRSGGCDCRIAAKRSGTETLTALCTLLLLGTLLVRRRRPERRGLRGAAALGAAAAALVLLDGCNCGGPQALPCNDECVAAMPPATAGSICCERTNECVAYDLDALCMPGFTCPPAHVTLDAMCGVSCSMCERKPPLDPGLLATDLDLVVTADGEIYLSGYSPGVPPSMPRYGDLVFGEVDPASGAVRWEIVDGAPTSPIVADPSGWRGGVSAAGPDVGRWTAMADSGTALYIAYYDATNGALKVAIGAPGAWRTHTVDDAGDAGRYASIALLEGGIPAIAYLRIEPATDGSGQVVSSVRVATARSAMPSSATDWTIVEVASRPMACRPQFCEGRGERCLASGRCVTPGSGCSPACGANEVCVAGSCQAALPDNYVEDLPPAYGLYTQLARTADGLALVWYDRGGGNLYGAAMSAGAWGPPFLIDGYARMADPAVERVGDSGLGVSLAVDGAGVWHVAYVDGAEEVLRYAQIRGGMVVLRETIDDGSTDGMSRHADGRHIVGDDSSIVVTPSGEVRVAYQDATAHHLMLATRPAGGGNWTVRVLDDANHTGFWVEQQLVGDTSYVATWWRQTMRTGSPNGVRVLTAP
jgi:hypothetical protein